MKRTKIARLLSEGDSAGRVRIMGWVRTRRDAKGFSFIEVNDGSCLKNIQVVADADTEGYDRVRGMTTGSAVDITGDLVRSPGKGQNWELRAGSVAILGEAPDPYPLQKKRHTDEFLRTIAHLRPRTNKYGATFRIRSALSFAIHRFFKERGFFYIHTPIITGSDCEGAGELFRVTSLDLDDPPTTGGRVDYTRDFFGREANLTVSGQLAVEMFALALSEVYTFGPTFRAENSNTRRHVAEFWMVEPEMAFCDLSDNMDLAEALVKALTETIMTECAQDLALFARFVDTSLMKRLEGVAGATFVRLPYREAVDILSAADRSFQFPVRFGADLQSEHERYLTEQHFRCPVIVYDYPKSIKPFYMRLNDDHETVAAMDVLVPGIGEIIGGSQREERYDRLTTGMEEAGLNPEDYWWYLDARRFGSVPHSGFGLGFERMMMLITGAANIRDVIPYPRTPGSIAF